MVSTYLGRWAAAVVLCGSGYAGVAASPLEQMDASMRELVKKVSPAVVKIVVVGYGPAETEGKRNTALIEKQTSVGSGVIVDPTGYIVTNAHVVSGAVHLHVILPQPLTAGSSALENLERHEKTVEGRVIGVSQTVDLAVVKIDGKDLPSLPLDNPAQVQQGEMAFAFGSPEGLENTVTMGLVSAALRQPDPDKPMVYVQTDAAINPGNSGGPLVDVHGNLIGINTFILTQSGGNEGLGFAIPAPMVRMIYPQIRKYGHTHRGQIGVNVQRVTPALEKGLGLSDASGVIISDLLAGGPADRAGVKTGDLVLALDGRPATSLPALEAGLFMKPPGSTAHLTVMRGDEKLEMDIPVVQRPHNFDKLADLVNPAKSLVPRLGILGVEIDRDLVKELGGLRIETGVIVAARAADPARIESGLIPGDVIHSFNGVPVVTLDGLREMVSGLKPGEAVAMQIERDEALMYLSFFVD
jgi:serine protease Do